MYPLGLSDVFCITDPASWLLTVSCYMVWYIHRRQYILVVKTRTLLDNLALRPGTPVHKLSDLGQVALTSLGLCFFICRCCFYSRYVNEELSVV